MNAPRRVARCGRCGREGHYAPTCVWPEAAPAPAATSPAPATKPAPAPAAPTPEAAPLPEGVVLPPPRVKRREKPVESSEAMAVRVAAELRRQELAERPYEHTDAVHGVPGDDFLWRHTWTHHQTGEQLRMTVPLPPSGNRHDEMWTNGFVTARYVRDAETLAAYHKDSVIERLTAGGAVVERLWHELRREAKAPESPWSPA